MKKYKFIRVLESTHEKLVEISEKRVKEDALNWRYMDVTAEMVNKLHKKEIG